MLLGWCERLPELVSNDEMPDGTEAALEVAGLAVTAVEVPGKPIEEEPAPLKGDDGV